MPDDPHESENDRSGGDDAPDVFLDVPLLKVDEIDLEVEDLRAHVSLQAEVLDLLKLNVGVDATLGRVQLNIKGVEAQAQLRVRLDEVGSIIARVLDSVDRNPQSSSRSPEGSVRPRAISAGASAMPSTRSVRAPERPFERSDRERVVRPSSWAAAWAARWRTSARGPGRPPRRWAGAQGARSRRSGARPATPSVR